LSAGVNAVRVARLAGIAAGTGLLSAGLLWVAVLLAALPGRAESLEISGYAGIEPRLFFHSPTFAGQIHDNISAVLQPEFYSEWNAGRDSVLFTPFARLDSADGRRTHLDVRELLYQRVAPDWELRAGIGKVFWGVAESEHLVDIINQTDAIEDVDGEDKLGQPMLNLALIRDWGTVDLFILPGFRERSFAGSGGRLRQSLVVDTNNSSYESSAGDRHVDYALRWSQSMAQWDIGLSHFYGTSRAPRFVLDTRRPGPPILIPRYDLIHRSALDLQATMDNWLWKLELIHESGQADSHVAWVGGFEYTLTGFAGTRADLGLLAEHLFDSRGHAGPNPFQNDLFAGLRLALNDVQSSEVLAGVIQDLRGDASLFSIEASRRLGDRWKLELEARLWSRVKQHDPFKAIARDDYIQFSVLRYF